VAHACITVHSTYRHVQTTIRSRPCTIGKPLESKDHKLIRRTEPDAPPQPSPHAEPLPPDVHPPAE
jgi:hypothetical protein